MRELIYQVEFLSDVVLPATSNTEGNIEQLDFIAGSNFLGIAAKNYTQFENSFAVFHSGAVKYGDAHILCNNKLTYKIPLSYFHEKLNDEIFLNHHLIRDFKKYKQLKQKRKGYITRENNLIYIEYNYQQKSAYDKEKRRSKDSSMFGYSAIKSGTTWQFSIQYDDSISSNDLELLQKSIVGKQRLGKSKSAQYGLVEITQKGLSEDIEDKDSNELILYANSRLALFDNEGNPTYDLRYLFDGLKDENILHEKCQLKTSTFTPYNGARQTKDYERVCINKGSVIVLQNVVKNDVPKFVGAFQSEGFGHLLINPQFLLQNEFSLKERFNKTNDKSISITSSVAKFLKNRVDKQEDRLKILNDVDEFISNYKSLYGNIKPSQWGKIRSICTSTNENFLDEIQEYIGHGTKEWEKKQQEKLLKYGKSLEFIKLLSIQIPKAQSRENNND
jgi:hypothetical protein